jgi:CRP-like cAMP-binding protein
MAIDPELFKYVANEETYPDKAVIIKEGTHGDWVYLIIEGQVKVKKKAPKGMLTITTLMEGSVFGELIFLQMNKGKRTASVVADGPVTVGMLDMALLGKAYHSVSPLLKELISTLARRLQDSTSRLVSLTSK